MKRRLAILMAGPALAWAALPSEARPEPAGELDRAVGVLVSPGALADAHAQLVGVTDCTSCHTALGGTPDALCLECHEDVAESRVRRRGVHGSFEGSCASCHVEHRGEGADLSGLDRETFHHGRTRFPLRGAHLDVDCETCHESAHPETGRVAFRTLGLAFERCGSCHEDVHGEAFLEGRDCAVCHDEASWQAEDLRLAGAEAGESGRGFEHGRDTSFPLEGRHAQVDCASCHSPQQPEDPPGTAAPTECGGCHEDPHGAALGGDCSGCHDPAGWKGDDTPFDHASRTEFALDALHGKLECGACHENATFSAAGTACAECHEDAAALLSGRFGAATHAPDPHDGRIDCRDCHPAEQATARLLDHERSCVGCHDASYAALLLVHKRSLDERVVELEAALRRTELAAARGEDTAPADLATVAERVRRLARSGLHHAEFAELLLRREREALELRSPSGAAVQVPDRAAD